MNIDFEISKLTIPYIQAFSCTENENGCVHKKRLPFLSVVSPVNGYYEISRDEEPSIIVREGECFIVAAGVYHTIVHHFFRPHDPIRPKWIFLQAKYMECIDLTAVVNPPLAIRGTAAGCFLQAIDTLLVNRDNNSLPCVCQRMEVAMRLFQDILAVSPPLSDQPLISPISPALKVIEAHLSEKLTLDLLAKACHMSRTTFCALFHKIMGVTAMAYITQKRLSKAAILLADYHLTLSDIACRTGFYDEYHLSRVFKKYYEFSPQMYKKTFYPK